MDLSSNILWTSCILTATILPFSISILIDFHNSHFRDVCHHCTTVFSNLSVPAFCARLILSYRCRSWASIRLLLRCHLCSQAIKPRHLTLSPEEKHSTEPAMGGGSHLVMKQQKLAMNYFWEERYTLRGNWIWSGQGEQRHCSMFLFKMPRFPCGKTVREPHSLIKYLLGSGYRTEMVNTF